MAILVSCLVCGKDVASDIGGACPYCKTNDPVGKIARRRRQDRIFGTFMFFAAVVGLVWLYMSGRLPPIVYKIIQFTG